MKKKTIFKVALIGRTNVGKSSLFNRLRGDYQAIVSSDAHTTRDRKITLVEWRGYRFELIDTGGLDVDFHNDIEESIVRQAEIALKEADLIAFVVDGKIGVLPEDREIAKHLRKGKKPIILLVNKMDKPDERLVGMSDFFSLGLKEILTVSAVNGGGTGDFLEMIVQNMLSRGREEKKSDEKKSIRAALIGKPNVGKSSLLNAILGYERVIVSPIPHTTREPIDTEFIYKDTFYTLLDTAGIRRRTKIFDSTTKKGIEETLETLRNVDVVLFVVEAVSPITMEDKHIVAEILERGVAIVLVVNKWDKVEEKESGTIKTFEKFFRTRFPYLWWVPISFVSALEKQRVHKMLDNVLHVYQERERILDAKELDNFFTRTIKKHQPSRSKNGKKFFLYGISQIASSPPVFELRIQGKETFPESYVRFLENQIRKKFGFDGTPLRVQVKVLK